MYDINMSLMKPRSVSNAGPILRSVIGWLAAGGVAWATGALHAGPPAPKSRPALTTSQRDYYRRMAARAEPDGAGRPAQLDRYLDFFRRELMNDPRLFVCDVQASATADGRVRVSGLIEFSENRAALVHFLTALGFADVENTVRVVPTAALGDRRLGLVRVAHSLSYDRAAEPREVVTDCLLGEPLYLLAGPEQGHYLCHSGEGYTGYVQAADVERVTPADFVRCQQGPSVIVRRDFAVRPDLTLPFGARLSGLAPAPSGWTVQLPGGAEVIVPETHGRWCDASMSTSVVDLLDQARQLLGAPYMWGGKTRQGVDCSGLVQTVFGAAGIRFPRDSNQQVYVGRLVGTRWFPDALRPGDTMYFLGHHGKISHTGIYLGEGQYLEAVRPVVRISRFEPGGVAADAGRSGSFAFAKRVLD